MKMVLESFSNLSTFHVDIIYFLIMQIRLWKPFIYYIKTLTSESVACTIC